MDIKKVEHTEVLLQNVKYLRITKDKKGYFIESEKDKIHLPDATNFDWRIKDQVEIEHMYFGAENGKFSDLSINITFKTAIHLRISNGHPRCYIHIDDSKNI